MATTNLQSSCASSNPIVAAYLAARAKDEQIDHSDGPNDSFEARMAQFAKHGAEHFAMTWGIRSADHGALVALLTADRLQNLIDGYSLTNDRRQKVVTFGAEEMYEVKQIKDALVNLWRYLDSYPGRRLQALASDLGLVGDHGTSLD